MGGGCGEMGLGWGGVRVVWERVRWRSWTNQRRGQLCKLTVLAAVAARHVTSSTRSPLALPPLSPLRDKALGDMVAPTAPVGRGRAAELLPSPSPSGLPSPSPAPVLVPELLATPFSLLLPTPFPEPLVDPEPLSLERSLQCCSESGRVEAVSDRRALVGFCGPV